jgi:hypothetical protein
MVKPRNGGGEMLIERYKDPVMQDESVLGIQSCNCS